MNEMIYVMLVFIIGEFINVFFIFSVEVILESVTIISPHWC